MRQDNEAQAPGLEDGRSFFRGLFGRARHEIPGRDSQLRFGSEDPLDLSDIQGFILRGYRMPMVRHFLLSVGIPGEARKLLGRFVNGNEADAPQITTAEDWHVGFEPGPEDDPADAPRANLLLS